MKGPYTGTETMVEISSRSRERCDGAEMSDLTGQMFQLPGSAAADNLVYSEEARMMTW